jgi:hypothetical protein
MHYSKANCWLCKNCPNRIVQARNRWVWKFQSSSNDCGNVICLGPCGMRSPNAFVDWLAFIDSSNQGCDRPNIFDRHTTAFQCIRRRQGWHWSLVCWIRGWWRREAICPSQDISESRSVEYTRSFRFGIQACDLFEVSNPISYIRSLTKSSSLTPQDVEKWTLHLGITPWFQQVEKTCSYVDLVRQDGTLVTCFAFSRTHYHPKFGFPGYRIAFAVKPVTKEFDPLNGIAGQVDLKSFKGLTIIENWTTSLCAFSPWNFCINLHHHNLKKRTKERFQRQLHLLAEHQIQHTQYGATSVFDLIWYILVAQSAQYGMAMQATEIPYSAYFHHPAHVFWVGY